MFSFLLGKYLRAELVYHVVNANLTCKETAKLFSSDSVSLHFHQLHTRVTVA